jgi:hypothetical protein
LPLSLSFAVAFNLIIGNSLLTAGYSSVAVAVAVAVAVGVHLEIGLEAPGFGECCEASVVGFFGFRREAAGG